MTLKSHIYKIINLFNELSHECNIIFTHKNGQNFRNQQIRCPVHSSRNFVTQKNILKG